MAEEKQKTIPKVTDADSSSAIASKKAPTPTRRKPKQLPRFRVLLHNDDVNHFDHVILSVMRLTPLSEQEALLRTLEAHETGVSLLLVTHQERAELYVDQFASVKITVTLEPE